MSVTAATRAAPQRLAVADGDLGLGTVIAVAVGVGVSVQRVSGATLLHVATLLVLPVVVPSALRSPILRRATVLFGLASVITLVSARLHHAPSRGMIRDFTIPWLTVLAAYMFHYLLRERRRQRAVLVGATLGLLMGALLYPSPGARLDAWKYGLGVPTALVVAAVLGFVDRRSGRITVPAVLLTLTGVNIVLGYRSEVVILVLSLIVVTMRDAGRRVAITRVRLVATTLIGVAVAYGGYGWLAHNGHLGEDQRVKWELQTSSPFGVIGGGRPEFMVAGTIIQDSPLLGTGGQPPLGDLRARALDVVRRRTGAIDPTVDRYYFGDGNNMHSGVGQAWVDYGIVAALPLLYVVYLCYRTLRKSGTWFAERHAVIVAVLSFQTLWDLAFSPRLRLAGIFQGLLIALAAHMLAERDRDVHVASADAA